VYLLAISGLYVRTFFADFCHKTTSVILIITSRHVASLHAGLTLIIYRAGLACMHLKPTTAVVSNAILTLICYLCGVAKGSPWPLSTNLGPTRNTTSWQHADKEYRYVCVCSCAVYFVCEFSILASKVRSVSSSYFRSICPYVFCRFLPQDTSYWYSGSFPQLTVRAWNCPNHTAIMYSINQYF